MEIPMDENTATPDEFVKLRDQLALDLNAIVSHEANARRSAEYLLASGLVPLVAIRARYDETHPATDEVPKPLTIDVPGSISNSSGGDNAPVGAVYEDADRPGQTWLYRKTKEGWERTGRDHRAGFNYSESFLGGFGPMYPLTFVRMDDLS